MAEIELSSQLFQDIRTAVLRQRPDAGPETLVQYLAAVMGYWVASQTQISDAQAREYLDELCAFAHQVADDVASQQHARQAEAFGYWDPQET